MLGASERDGAMGGQAGSPLAGAASWQRGRGLGMGKELIFLSGKVGVAHSFHRSGGLT